MVRDWGIPGGHCATWLRGRKAVQLPKAEFDRLAKAVGFIEGPFRDTFGDGYGEPYNPNRQAFGRLRDGRLVFAELTPEADR